MSGKSWDTRFIDLAKLVSTWSKDPSTKVGAVITDDNNRVISLGYNGFPKNIQDISLRLVELVCHLLGLKILCQSLFVN